MSKPGSRGRWIPRSITVLIVAGAVVGSVVAVQQLRPDDEAVAPAPVLQAARAERTDLSGSVSLDGTVENSSTLEVLHRIPGATPSTSSATTSPDATATAGPPSAQGVGFVRLEPATLTDAAPTSVESTTTVVATTTSGPTPTAAPDTTTSEPTTTASPDTTTTPPDTTTTVPIETTSPAAPESTSPPATVPSAEQPADSSTPGAMPSGSRGGAVPPAGVGSGGVTGGTATASTENVTERVTSLPALGATIELGDVLYSVDGTPVVAMSGVLPAWRSLSSGADGGSDIAQLETSLLALGYDANGSIVVDNEWDSATTKAVKAWQTGLGLEDTGEVELGAIVFLPSTVTVTSLATSVGADVTEQDHILDVSGASQQVVAAVSEDAEGTVVPGLTVQISSATPVDGVVTLMRSVTGDDGTITVQAVVTPATALVDQADGSAVDVEVDVDGPSDAITVPADALVSKLDGTYQVKVRDESGDHWVVVEIIDARGSTVAVSGIDEGTSVLVPA